MNAKSKWLTEKDGNIIIPKTLDSQTFDSDGNSLAERLRGIDDTEVIQLPKVDPTLIISDLDYSTEEQLTGKRWIDGRPIYQKTVVIDTPSVTGTDIRYPHGIENVDEIIDGKTKYIRSDGVSYTEPIYIGGSVARACAFDATDIIITLQSINISTIKVTIFYTKTTDTADSPVDMPVVDKLPFKLGIDENGNYGYIKVGADTVTPFKSGSDGLAYRIIQPFYKSYVEVRLVN